MDDLHELWGHRWLTPKAKSAKSKIHDFGVIAVANISKGEVVRVTGGLVIPKQDLGEYHKITAKKYEIQVSDDFFLAPAKKEEVEKEMGVFNHSCDTNLGFLDVITLVAIKDIKVGEELVVEYAFCQSDFEPFTCNCGSANCRKIIKPDDWKNPELQKKYGKYFSPYLKRKFLSD